MQLLCRISKRICFIDPMIFFFHKFNHLHLLFLFVTFINDASLNFLLGIFKYLQHIYRLCTFLLLVWLAPWRLSLSYLNPLWLGGYSHVLDAQGLSYRQLNLRARLRMQQSEVRPWMLSKDHLIVFLKNMGGGVNIAWRDASCGRRWLNEGILQLWWSQLLIH